MRNRFFVRLCLVLLSLVCSLSAGAVAAEEPVAGISLNTPQVWHVWPKDSPDGKGHHGSPLAMELARQAILIAARDELGLRTLDASLGEPAELPGVLPLTVEIDLIFSTESRIQLKTADKLLLNHGIPVLWNEHQSEIDGVIKHEAFSREQAVKALREGGLQGKPNKWLDSAAVPEEIQVFIDQFSLISQFRAVRALHRLIAEEGESPERLWALSRVYSNLAQESRWFIRCQFASFQARSILYAYRLRAKAPGHVLGDLSAAYAWMMTGYSQWAEPYLIAAETALKDKPDLATPALLDWSTLLRACYLYDQPALDGIMKKAGPTAPVAALWTVFTNEFVKMNGLTFNAIEQAMKVNPLSTRYLYAGYDAMGVSSGHWLTEAAPKHFTLVTSSQLARIDKAPEKILAVFSKVDPKGMGLRALTETGWALCDLTDEGEDPDEMSYGVLGTLIGEANALHVLYRAKFMRNQWGVDTSDYLRGTIPALSRHPFQPLILTFLYRKSTRNEMVQKVMAKFEPGYVNYYNLSTFVWQTPNDFKYANGMTESQWWSHAVEMRMNAGCEWLCGVRWSIDDAGMGSRARSMDTYDRHHPKRLALLVKYYNLPEKRIKGIAGKYGHHTLVADALAFKMEEFGQLQLAVQYAELAATMSPERKTVERHARLELLIGNEKKWLALMKSILDLPDNGLDHAKINQIIAHTFMNQGRYEDALPYSKASADSWAGWAMKTYVINLAVLGKHNEAQAIGRRMNERYGMDYLAEQYVQIWAGIADQQLCQSIERYYVKRYGNKRAEIDWQMLYIEIGMGMYEQALKRVEANVAEGQPNSRVLSFGVMVAQRLGRDKLRDKLLTMLIEYPPVEGERVRFALLGDLMKQGLEKGKIDWQAAERWAKRHDEDGVEMPMALGLFALQMPDDRERALAELLTLAKVPKFDGPLTIIARAALRLEGYTDEQMLPTGYRGHTWPERQGQQ